MFSFLVKHRLYFPHCFYSPLFSYHFYIHFWVEFQYNDKGGSTFYCVKSELFLNMTEEPVITQIDENFAMLGMVSSDKTVEIYTLSDMTLNCSSLEGLALTSYESLAMGVPVVSTDVGGQTELIDDTVGAIVHYHKDATEEE